MVSLIHAGLSVSPAKVVSILLGDKEEPTGPDSNKTVGDYIMEAFIEEKRKLGEIGNTLKEDAGKIQTNLYSDEQVTMLGILIGVPIVFFIVFWVCYRVNTSGFVLRLAQTAWNPTVRVYKRMASGSFDLESGFPLTHGYHHLGSSPRTPGGMALDNVLFDLDSGLPMNRGHHHGALPKKPRGMGLDIFFDLGSGLPKNRGPHHGALPKTPEGDQVEPPRYPGLDGLQAFSGPKQI